MAKQKKNDPHFETKRNRDLVTIKDLFSIFPRLLVDRVLEEALSDRILTDHIDCLSGAEGIFCSTLFHLYDTHLKHLLDNFFNNWNAAWYVGRTTHHDHLHRGIATLSLSDTDPSDRWKEHDAYIEHVVNARRAMAGITKHLHEFYPDFDLVESDKEANQKYWEMVRQVEKRIDEMTGTSESDSNLTSRDGSSGAEMSKNETPASPRPTAPLPPKPDVLLVTVNKHETRAVLDAFEQATGDAAVAVPLDDRVYHNLGTLNGTTVFHAISEMGSGGAGGMQQTVDKAIRLLDPGSVIAVGIAFGVDDTEQAIGDILISKHLRLYELQKVDKQSKIVLRGARPDAASRLVNHFRGFADSKWDGVSIFSGVILTGEKLVDNKDYRKQLQAFESEAIGGEMEGAGLYVSSYDHKVDWIVVKAICDFADGNKGVDKTERQKRAAKNAADFVVQALKYAPLKRR